MINIATISITKLNQQSIATKSNRNLETEICTKIMKFENKEKLTITYSSARTEEFH